MVSHVTPPTFHKPAARSRRYHTTAPPPVLRASFGKYDDRGDHVSVGYNRFFLDTTTACSLTASSYPASPASPAETNGRTYKGLRVSAAENYRNSHGCVIDSYPNCGTADRRV
jgi:hypothetical protein